MSNRIMDEAIQWALKMKEDLPRHIQELNAQREEGLFVEDGYYNTVLQLSKMSIEDLKRERLKQLGLDRQADGSTEEFSKVVTQLGTFSSDPVVLSNFIESRKEKYITYYKLDAEDPGLIFILNQLIQDEMQINKLRQDLILIGFSGQTQSDQDDQNKLILDLIVKLNKAIFECTKYLKQEKIELELKETAKVEKEQAQEEQGLRFSELMGQLQSDPRFEKAKTIQSKKKKEYVAENLDAAEQ